MKVKNKADFNFWVPIDFEKSRNEKTGEKVMKIKGIASTPDQDSEGEILEPIGFDLKRFLSTGFLNWNHQAKNDASKVIGEPTLAKVTNDGKLYVEGVLYNGHPLAESVWSLAETLKNNNSKRKLGFSIEGRALERDIINPKKITKALLTGLAVTPTPVNTNTYLDLCKGEQKDDFIEYEFDNEADLNKSEDAKYIFEFTCDNKDFGITKSFEVEEIRKTTDVASTATLVPESLDGKKIKLTPEIHKAVVMGIVPIEDVLEKARGGVYANTAENRKKGRVGQKYGGSGIGENYSEEHLENLVKRRDVDHKYFEEMNDKELAHLHNFANSNLFNSGLNDFTKKKVKEWWRASSDEMSRRKKMKGGNTDYSK